MVITFATYVSMIYYNNFTLVHYASYVYYLYDHDYYQGFTQCNAKCTVMVKYVINAATVNLLYI